jgi:hypothetical protein
LLLSQSSSIALLIANHSSLSLLVSRNHGITNHFATFHFLNHKRSQIQPNVQSIRVGASGRRSPSNASENEGVVVASTQRATTRADRLVRCVTPSASRSTLHSAGQHGRCVGQERPGLRHPNGSDWYLGGNTHALFVYFRKGKTEGQRACHQHCQ